MNRKGSPVHVLDKSMQMLLDRRVDASMPIDGRCDEGHHVVRIGIGRNNNRSVGLHGDLDAV